MLVKGIITEIKATDNVAKVRIPTFESAGEQTQTIITASISYTPGNVMNYRPGDCVFVLFENDQLTSPVIFGKLYLGKEEQATNYSYCNSLEVVNNAILPIDTKIGDMNFSNVIHNINNIASLQDKIEQLDELDAAHSMPIITVVGQVGSQVLVDSTSPMRIVVRVVSGTVKVGDELVLSAICNWNDQKEDPHHTGVKRKHRTIWKYVITEEDLSAPIYQSHGIIFFSLVGAPTKKLRYTYSKSENRNFKYIRLRRNSPTGYICSNHVVVKLDCGKSEDSTVQLSN